MLPASDVQLLPYFTPHALGEFQVEAQKYTGNGHQWDDCHDRPREVDGAFDVVIDDRLDGRAEKGDAGAEIDGHHNILVFMLESFVDACDDQGDEHPKRDDGDADAQGPAELTVDTVDTDDKAGADHAGAHHRVGDVRDIAQHENDIEPGIHRADETVAHGLAADIEKRVQEGE